MYRIILACAGSIPADGGVRCDCQSMVPPMINGRRLKGSPTPGIPNTGMKPSAGTMNSVSVLDRSAIHRKWAVMFF